MISAGNDIVCLTATNVTRTKSPEFYAKIISPAEKALLNTLDQASLPFDRFVWLLWSVKESAYKYLHRLDPAIVFTPVKFEVQSVAVPSDFSCSDSGTDTITGLGLMDLTLFSGTITYGGITLFFRSMIFTDIIASFVNAEDDFFNLRWGIKRVDESSYKFQSDAVRQFVLEELRTMPGLYELTIEKTEDEIPVLWSCGKRLEMPVSLSHHGHWVAFAVQTQGFALR